MINVLQSVLTRDVAGIVRLYCTPREIYGLFKGYTAEWNLQDEVESFCYFIEVVEKTANYLQQRVLTGVRKDVSVHLGFLTGDVDLSDVFTLFLKNRRRLCLPVIFELLKFENLSLKRRRHSESERFLLLVPWEEVPGTIECVIERLNSVAVHLIPFVVQFVTSKAPQFPSNSYLKSLFPNLWLQLPK